jgi:hypothetical protein
MEKRQRRKPASGAKIEQPGKPTGSGNSTVRER